MVSNTEDPLGIFLMPLLWKYLQITLYIPGPCFPERFLWPSVLCSSWLTPCSSQFWRCAWTAGGNYTLYTTSPNVKELSFKKTVGWLEILVHYGKYCWDCHGDKILPPRKHSSGNAMKSNQPGGRGQPWKRESSIPREFAEMYLQFSLHVLILFVTQGF